MISDVLFEAIREIDRYLGDSTYAGDLRDRIINVRREMWLMMRELDTPPGAPPFTGEVPEPPLPQEQPSDRRLEAMAEAIRAKLEERRVATSGEGEP